MLDLMGTSPSGDNSFVSVQLHDLPKIRLHKKSRLDPRFRTRCRDLALSHII